MTRVRARVDGTVQGVGFRPFVYRLAVELGVSGFVRNDSRGVLVEAEAERDVLERFLARLPAEAPAAARVAEITTRAIPATGAAGFRIRHSTRRALARTEVAPDLATCPDCLAELFDASDRRHRYPFINCTACGPRYTIVREVPYDRSRTTMAGFDMCRQCRAEYEDPGDRRFHAQPNACPGCGPQAWLADPGGTRLTGGRRDEAIVAAAQALREGAILAIKGLGGYHLACRAEDSRAVARLRQRKRRDAKPLALMVADVPAARELCELGQADEALLRSAGAPIVLLGRRARAAVAAEVAPGLPELGLMLPYTPLHHLLLRASAGPIVLTSGNRSEEPIAYRDDDALVRLAGIADAFLVHDRAIHIRAEDSVLRAAGDGAAGGASAGRPTMIRRSRGYVPRPLPLPVSARRPVLAVGARREGTFCLAEGRRALISHHLGDLDDWESLRSFRESIAHLERLSGIAPRLIACDLHPDYPSTGYAQSRAGCELVAVQHHHAHLAACLAEHGEGGPAVGAIYDGAGLGPDGTIWGGELLVGGLQGFERAGHLAPVPLPGGDQAAREPWRMACAWLQRARGEEPKIPRRLSGAVDPARWRAVAGLARSGTASPVTTSVGRLYDAIAAICGFAGRTSYEGQAAIELEALVDPGHAGAYAIAVAPDRHGRLVLDPLPAVSKAADDAAGGVASGLIAARFHRGLADATARACIQLAQERRLRTVVLSGGVFQNARLLSQTGGILAAAGLRVLVPERVPGNDGGISYGQAAVAAAAEIVRG